MPDTLGLDVCPEIVNSLIDGEYDLLMDEALESSRLFDCKEMFADIIEVVTSIEPDDDQADKFIQFLIVLFEEHRVDLAIPLMRGIFDCALYDGREKSVSHWFRGSSVRPDMHGALIQFCKKNYEQEQANNKAIHNQYYQLPNNEHYHGAVWVHHATRWFIMPHRNRIKHTENLLSESGFKIDDNMVGCLQKVFEDILVNEEEPDYG